MKKEDLKAISCVVSIFLPPAGVAIKEGIGASFFINILLTIIGYFPGLIHALYISMKD